MKQTVHLGYEVGSGRPIDIPLLNTVVTGMTQQSGKTTTLEALVSRSPVRALAFVTKRGESGFNFGRRIPPYFRERTDWEFVASILEAERREKMRFERAWIIKACKGARTLADVHQNVKLSLTKAKGISEGVYTTLDAYLENVVPAIAATRFAPSIELAPGLNVMDLTTLGSELIELVIASAMHWIYAKEKDVVTILPEAWEFAPQGRGSPVKQAARELVRKGSALHNFLWLDSQDIAGVEKELLRSCPVWLLGVQREANEIKRNLANIPAGIKKPRADDIATLERGQFYACWGKHSIKVYVQPAWMEAYEAKQIAWGKIDSADVQAPKPVKPKLEEINVTKEEADSLRRENEELKRRLASLERVAVAEKTAAPAPAAKVSEPLNGDEESLYQRIRARLIDEAPGVLKVLAYRPEIIVEIEREEVEADGKSLRGRVGRLVASNFFQGPRRHSEVFKELCRTGSEVNSGNLATMLKEFVRRGFLTDETEGYRIAPGAKARVVEK